MTDEIPPGCYRTKKGHIVPIPRPRLSGEDMLRVLRDMNQDREKQSLPSLSQRAVFGDRGFSDRTVTALVDCSIDAPERLLFMNEASLKTIPGIGKASLKEIMAYRSRFVLPSKPA